MIELERHIEILLLSNDCVIVPDLGGFMAYHSDAYYDEGDSIFLPPKRTLGFNPQLKINDSLLAQSYVEAYDISYPEAVQRIESEVEELKQHLQNEGAFELNDIGILALNEDGNYQFTPCEAGILTPSLYAFSSFDIQRLETLKREAAVPVQAPAPSVGSQPAQVVAIEPNAEEGAEEAGETDDDVIRIKFSWIRNTVAVAAILLAVFLLSLPTGDTAEMMQRKISNLNTDILFGMMSKDTNTSEIDIKKCDIRKVQAPPKDTLQRKDSVLVEKEAPAAEKEAPVEQKVPLVETQKKGFCIVLASYVSKQNAGIFVEELHKKGYDKAEIYIHNDITRVIYGNYPTSDSAHNDLRRIHQDKELKDAWVYEFN